jgi:osmoprotectant transport system ATP-binding protein
MIGLIQPDAGSILVRGRELKPAEFERFRHGVGYVLQDGGLFPHLTLKENALLMPQVLKWPHERSEQRIHELTQLLRLPADALNRYPLEVSGGQRQRVGLMRALMLDPELLLLDEPLGALDPIVRRELQEDLREIFRTLKKTVVLVTHDLGEAGFLSDQIVLMETGRIAQQGTLRDLVEHPSSDFVRKFVSAQRSPLEGVIP